MSDQKVHAQAHPSSLPTITVPKSQGHSSTADSHAQTSTTTPLSAELIIKANTQSRRLNEVKEIVRTLKEKINTPNDQTSLEELEVWKTQVDDLHAAFVKEHAYLESTWPAAHLEHEYISADTFTWESQAVLRARLLLTQLKKKVNSGPSSPAHSQPQPAQQDISLPRFSGDYVQWPVYKEAFSSWVLKQSGLNDLEKMHHLRASLSGTPAGVIAELPLIEDSFKLAWAMLISKYDNKRLIVQAHLNRLFDISPSAQRSAAALAMLVSVSSEFQGALTSLGMGSDMGECLLVHHLSRNLDKATLKKWEASLETLEDFPRLWQLEAFLSSEARVLDKRDTMQHTSYSLAASSGTAPTRCTSSPSQTSSQASSSTTSQLTYPCDCCQDNHFIVVCPKFRALTVPERRAIITHC